MGAKKSEGGGRGRILAGVCGGSTLCGDLVSNLPASVVVSRSWRTLKEPSTGAPGWLTQVSL